MWRNKNKMENVYAALLLHKAGKDITEESLRSILVAAGVEDDETKVKSLVASLKGVDIAKELESATLAVGSASPVSAEKPAEEKKEEKKEESAPAAEGLSALFG